MLRKLMKLPQKYKKWYKNRKTEKNLKKNYKIKVLLLNYLYVN